MLHFGVCHTTAPRLPTLITLKWSGRCDLDSAGREKWAVVVGTDLEDRSAGSPALRFSIFSNYFMVRFCIRIPGIRWRKTKTSHQIAGNYCGSKTVTEKLSANRMRIGMGRGMGMGMGTGMEAGPAVFCDLANSLECQQNFADDDLVNWLDLVWICICIWIRFDSIRLDC